MPVNFYARYWPFCKISSEEQGGNKVQKPAGVNQAVIAIWATIALSAISSLINNWMGVISGGEFAFNLFIYGLVCIIPYKIGNRSNAARYVYLIFVIIGIFFMLGNMGVEIPKLDMILSVVLIPVEVFILYRLFQLEASDWFTEQG